MSKPHHQKIAEAATLLGITSTATLAQVKEKYRALMKKWHPDTCGQDIEKCREMTTKLIIAYEIIVEYIENFKFSFKEDDVKKNLPVDRHDWWVDMYGEDPLWGRWEGK